MTIQEALENEITRDNCLTCPKKYYDEYSGIMKCEITEEVVFIGGYCQLKNI